MWARAFELFIPLALIFVLGRKGVFDPSPQNPLYHKMTWSGIVMLFALKLPAAALAGIVCEAVSGARRGEGGA